MTRFASWLLVILFAGAFGAAVYHVLQIRAARGKDLPAYSVYSEDRNGLAEAARLLRTLGWEPVALTRPVHQLRSSGGRLRLLVMVQPEETEGLLGGHGGLSEADVRGTVRWVEQGNTLLLCGRDETELHRALGVSVRTGAPPAGDEAPHDADLGEAGSYTEDVDRIRVEGTDTLLTDTGLPLWWNGDRPGAVLLRRGAGRVLVLADPSVLTRRGLSVSRMDNAVFLVRVAELHARDGRVYFDEYHHGLRSGGGLWGYLHFTGQQWVLLPLLAALAVAAWSVGVRLGPAVPAPAEVHTDAVAYTSALARIYELAGARHLLAKSLARDFLATLTRLLRLRRAALPAEILAAWRQRSPGTVERLQLLLRGAAELRQRDVSNRQLLTWTRAFDEFLFANDASEKRR